MNHTKKLSNTIWNTRPLQAIYASDKLGKICQSGNGGKLITHEPDIRSYLPLSNTKESIFSAQETVIH